MENIVRVEDFQRDVIERSFSVPVVVDFWAEWCGPCKMLGPVLERLAGEAGGRWTLATVDTEGHPQVSAEYGIRSIPNVKLFVEGKAVSEFTGALPEHAVRAWIGKAIPSASSKAIAAARAMISANDPTGAAALLEGVVASEPDNAEARVLLARAIVTADPKRALDLVRGVEEPLLADEMDTILTVARLRDIGEGRVQLPEAGVRPAYEAAVANFLRGDYDAALEGFIGVIREERYYDDDGSRKACLAVFRLLGEEHGITQRHRRDFGSALYV
jgi:putative thioredoxin